MNLRRFIAHPEAETSNGSNLHWYSGRGRPQAATNVPFGSKADICSAKRHVPFTPHSDIDCVFPHVCFGPKANIRERSRPRWLSLWRAAQNQLPRNSLNFRWAHVGATALRGSHAEQSIICSCGSWVICFRKCERSSG